MGLVLTMASPGLLMLAIWGGMAVHARVGASRARDEGRGRWR